MIWYCDGSFNITWDTSITNIDDSVTIRYNYTKVFINNLFCNKINKNVCFACGLFVNFEIHCVFFVDKRQLLFLSYPILSWIHIDMIEHTYIIHVRKTTKMTQLKRIALKTHIIHLKKNHHILEKNFILIKRIIQR